MWTSSVKQTKLIPDKIDLRSPDQKKTVRNEANFIDSKLLLRDRVLRHLVHNAPGSCDHGDAVGGGDGGVDDDGVDGGSLCPGKLLSQLR